MSDAPEARPVSEPRKTLVEMFGGFDSTESFERFLTRLREADALEEKLPCGHRRADNDDSYGGCVLCGFHRGEIEAEKEYDALAERYARLRNMAKLVLDGYASGGVTLDAIMRLGALLKEGT